MALPLLATWGHWLARCAGGKIHKQTNKPCTANMYPQGKQALTSPFNTKIYFYFYFSALFFQTKAMYLTGYVLFLEKSGQIPTVKMTTLPRQQYYGHVTILTEWPETDPDTDPRYMWAVINTFLQLRIKIASAKCALINHVSSQPNADFICLNSSFLSHRTEVEANDKHCFPSTLLSNTTALITTLPQ